MSKEKEQRAERIAAIRKLKSGRTLTAVERELVEGPVADAVTEHVKTRQALANRCRINRRHLNRYLAMEGCPVEVEGKGWPVDAVKRFILSKARRSDVAGKIDDAVEDLRKWEIYERARRAHLRNENEVGARILKSHHNAIIAGMVAECQRVLDAMPQKMAPEVVGLTVPEAEIRLRHAIHESILALKTGSA